MLDPIDIEKVRGIIEYNAAMWSTSFNKTAVISKDDLVQEGWEVYLCIVRDGKYDPDRGCSFYTFLSSCLRGKFHNLLKNHSTQNRYIPLTTDESDVASDSNNCDPERLMMVSGALRAMSEISADFVTMIVDEMPKDLYRMIKRKMRRFTHKSGFNSMNGKIRLKPEMVEDFFGVKISDLKSAMNKHL